jgi:predicted GIY-YIG superfamily endonuclease
MVKTINNNKMSKIGYIYVIENNFDHNVYIGLTTKTIHERFALKVS